MTGLLEYEPEHLAWPILHERLYKLSTEEAEAYLKARKQRIERAQLDPLRYGYVPPIWEEADRQIEELREKRRRETGGKGVIKLIIFGGIRSSKTRFASNLLNKSLKEKDGARWWATDSTEAQSRANQMRLIMEQFPPEWKELERDLVTDVRYSLSDGFPKNLFVCPNKSECYFKFYTIELKNLPGPELDGVWCVVGRTKIKSQPGYIRACNVKVGDAVTTRHGLRTVTACSSRLAPVGRVKFSNGEELVGTKDHPVLTTVRGWVTLQDLHRDDLCVSNVWNGTVKSGIATGKNITHGRKESGYAKKISGFVWPYIERFGKNIMGLYGEAMTFITRMATFLTTPLKIFSPYPGPITCGAIYHREGLTDSLIEELNRQSKPHASSVDESLPGRPGTQKCQFAEHVGSEKQTRNGIEHIRENVRYVEPNSKPEVDTTVASVVSTWEDAGEDIVYNLKVEGTPEYFANGILCHNCDELVPLPWVHFLAGRCANRNGLMVITFTPEFGWNETYGYFFEGAQILKEADALILPNHDRAGRVIGYEKVPRVMQCVDPLARIIFFHTFDNPFGNAESVVQEEKAKGSNVDSIKIKLYGVCTKSHKVAFPMFNKRAHVITEASFQQIVQKSPMGVRFHLVDPCDGRNWFMGWVFCPKIDWWIIYREWPSHSHQGAYIKGHGIPGPWAVSGAAADGVRGPGQDTLGFSLERYKEEIEDKETEPGSNGEGVREDIFRRYIDSRYATSPHVDRESVTTLQEQCQQVGLDFLCMVAESKILGAKDGSIDMINSALFYDLETEIGKWSPGLSRLNVPKLQVVETCPNTIYALEHWTGQDGQRGACKDPIDVIRGLFLTGLNHVSSDMYTWVGGGVP